MGQIEEHEPKKHVVYAPQPEDANASSAPAVNQQLAEDEDVQWQWTHYTDGRSAVTDYTIVKKTEQPD